MQAINDTLKQRIKAAGDDAEVIFKLKTVQGEEFRVLYALILCYKYKITPAAKRQSKSAKLSTKFRNEGNRIFISNNSAKHFAEACELYSKSIAYAPSNSSELALAYANRSAVLFRLGMLEKCLQDIDRAFAQNYPENLKDKLNTRKHECLDMLDKLRADQDKEEPPSIQQLHLDDDNADGRKMNKRVEKARICRQDMNKNEKLDWFQKMLRNFEECKKNREIPCASDSLELKYSKTFGRHVVATRDIDIGEIVIMEKPYTLILVLENVYTHCSECLRVSWNSIPCEGCVYAMYCSEKCKDEAWKKCHDIECQVVGYLVDLEMNNLGLMSLRLAILAVREEGGITNLQLKTKEIDSLKDNRKRGFSSDGKFHSDTYRSVYTLTTNTEKRHIMDIYDRALNAAFIVYYLSTQSTFFGAKLDQPMYDLADDELITFVGGLIFRHQQIIPSNIHCYSEERSCDRVERGAAALPFCSLINHSCDPNLSRISYEGYEILYPLYPIKKGEQLFDNYGSHYAMMTKQERQSKLRQQFCFDCFCNACRDDWPLYESIPPYSTRVSSLAVRSKLDKALSKLQHYIAVATVGDLEKEPDIFQDLVNMLKELVRRVPMPCIQVNNVQETLKRIMELVGNKFHVPKYIV